MNIECALSFILTVEILCTNLSHNQSNFHVVFSLFHGGFLVGLFYFALAVSLMAIIIKSVSKQE